MSVKVNFVYNTILTCSSYIFSFATYPYVSRVLGVTNIGICNFVTSIVSYFLLFSTMGIVILGTREIAKCNGDKEKITNCFYNLFYINLIATLIVAVVYVLSIWCIPQLYPYRDLLYIGLLQIIMTPFLIEWFFKGIEDFKYITIRSLIVKIIYVIGVFLFIKTPSDYKLYFFLTCGMMVCNASFNWFHKNKFIIKTHFTNNFKNYLKGFFILGLYMLLTSMYTTFTTTYLGFVGGNNEVGYYATAMKLQNIVLAFYTAFTGVMAPRMSSLVGQNQTDKANSMIYKSFDILFVFSIPLVIFSIIYAPQIINILAGAGYEKAIAPMRITMVLILIIGIEQILVIQFLMPYKEDKAIFINSILGAIVGVGLNLILVKSLFSIGAALVSVSSEAAVMIASYLFIRHKYGNFIPFKSLLYNVFWNLPIIPILYFISQLISSSLWSVMIGILALCCYIIFVQGAILKNQFLMHVIFKIKHRNE